MTEYIKSEFSSEPFDTPYENGTVIEDEGNEFFTRDEQYAAAERLVDLGVANMADASKMVGYEPEESLDTELDALFSVPERLVPVKGVTVGLGERATAVTLLLDSVAMHNKLDGAQKSGAVRDPAMVAGMRSKAANFRASQNIAIETLAKTQEMQRAGFSDEEIVASKSDVLQTMRDFSGKGPAVTAKRHKEKRTVARTDRRSRGEKR